MKKLLLPAFLILTFFFYLPLIFIFFYSFSHHGNSGTYGLQQFLSTSLENYKSILNPLYFNIYFNTIKIVTLTILIMLILAYCVAIFITSLPTTLKKVFLFCLIVPSFVGFITKIYAIFICFKPTGNLLPWVGEWNLLGSQKIVALGLLSIYLPFVILPIFFDLEKIEKNVIEAAQNLGASQWQIFRKIRWPLSLRGVATGLMISIPMFGEMAIIKILGGVKVPFLGVLIVDEFVGTLSPNWPFGSALTVSLIALTSLSVFLLTFATRRYQ